MCVASVADQEIEHEHIIQDACSDDGTPEWLEADGRAQCYFEKDQGMYDAVNRGLRRAQGEILAYLNGDEQYLPGTLALVDRFFHDNPHVALLVADAIIIDREGNYRFHRKTQVPLLGHTWTDHLSTLTCATFFRRSLIDEHQLFYDTRWRVVGDREWMLRVLKLGVRIAHRPVFTSTFGDTGDNLSTRPEADREERALVATAPKWRQALHRPYVWHHRLRRMLTGKYRQAPFSYSVYTAGSPDQRRTFHVEQPTFRWKLASTPL